MTRKQVLYGAFTLALVALAGTAVRAQTPAEIEANVADAAQAVPPALWRDLKSAGLLDPSAPTG